MASIAEIGQKFGPFDLSFIPIWRGGTLGFISWSGLRVRLCLWAPLSESLTCVCYSSPTNQFHRRSTARRPTPYQSTWMSRAETRSVRLYSISILVHLLFTFYCPGIHFGTFVGAETESLEAVIELQEACEEAEVRDLEDGLEVTQGRMGVLDQGQSWRVKVEELIVF